MRGRGLNLTNKQEESIELFSGKLQLHFKTISKTQFPANS